MKPVGSGGSDQTHSQSSWVQQLLLNTNCSEIFEHHFHMELLVVSVRLLSKKNIRDKVQFLKDHQSQSRNNVLWTQEAEMEVFGHSDSRHIWFRPKIDLQERKLKATVKHGGWHVMVYCCFAASETGHLSVFSSTLLCIKENWEIMSDHLCESWSWIWRGHFSRIMILWTWTDPLMSDHSYSGNETCSVLHFLLRFKYFL